MTVTTDIRSLFSKIINFLTYAYLLTAYMLSSSRFGNPILIAELLLIILFTLLRDGKWGLYFKVERIHVYMGLFTCICGFSIAIATEKHFAFSMTLALVKICLSTWVVFHSYARAHRVNDLLGIAMSVGYTMVLIAFAFYGAGIIQQIFRGGELRLNNDLININTLGIAAATSVIINVYKICRDGFSLYSVMIIPSIVIIAASGSRKSLVFLVLGIVLFFILKNSHKKGYGTKVIKVVVFVVLFTVAFYLVMKLPMFHGLNARMQGLISSVTNRGTVDHSTWLRMNYTKLGVDIFKQHPVLGIGIDNARLIAKSKYGYDHYLHNNYVELLAGVGIVGFLVYYAFYAYLIISLLRKIKRKDIEISICFALTIMFLIIDYGMVSYYAKETYFYLMLVYIKVRQLRSDRF